MKTLCILVFALAIPFALSAQTLTQADKLFKKHSSDKGYSTAHLTTYMLHLFVSLADEEAQENFQNFTKDMAGIKLLTIDSLLEPIKSETFFADMTAALTAANYTTLNGIDSPDKKLQLMIWSENGKIKEVVLVGELFMAVLLGTLEMEQVVGLGENIYIEGFDQLDSED